jgi:hypothetical protein
VADAGQERMDADCDCKNNKGEHTDGYEKNAEDFYVAIRNSQHHGHSVSAGRAPRNITGRGYGGARDLP